MNKVIITLTIFFTCLSVNAYERVKLNLNIQMNIINQILDKDFERNFSWPKNKRSFKEDIRKSFNLALKGKLGKSWIDFGCYLIGEDLNTGEQLLSCLLSKNYSELMEGLSAEVTYNSRTNTVKVKKVQATRAG